MRTAAFAAATLVASHAFAAQTCAISGERAVVGPVRVATGGAPFTLHAVGVPVTAYVDEHAPTVVEVESPLFFTGTPVDLPPYTLKSSVEGAGGVARLPSDEAVLAVRVRRGEVAIDVELDHWTKVIARDVSVPCDALTLDWPRKFSRQQPSREEDDGAFLAPVGQLLTFHERPGAGHTVRLEMADPKSVTLRRFRDDSRWPSPWVRVEAQINRAVIAGWVARSAIAETAFGTIGSGSRDTMGFGCSSGGEAVAATIEGGARVYAEPGRLPWAFVQSSDGWMVRETAQRAWVQIVSASGIQDTPGCPGLTHAFVQRSAVVFPARVDAIAP